MPWWSIGENHTLQVRGHLNAPEDESEGNRHVMVLLSPRNPQYWQGWTPREYQEWGPSQPHDILRTAEEWPSWYSRSMLLPGRPFFLPMTHPFQLAPEALITPRPEMATVSTRPWDLLASRACSCMCTSHGCKVLRWATFFQGPRTGQTQNRTQNGLGFGFWPGAPSSTQNISKSLQHRFSSYA